MYNLTQPVLAFAVAFALAVCDEFIKLRERLYMSGFRGFRYFDVNKAQRKVHRQNSCQRGKDGCLHFNLGK